MGFLYELKHHPQPTHCIWRLHVQENVCRLPFCCGLQDIPSEVVDSVDDTGDAFHRQGSINCHLEYPDRVHKLSQVDGMFSGQDNQTIEVISASHSPGL